jgi:Na+-transporting NADH:ubiquinone oxidoreductase subunit NqrB
MAASMSNKAYCHSNDFPKNLSRKKSFLREAEMFASSTYLLSLLIEYIYAMCKRRFTWLAIRCVSISILLTGANFMLLSANVPFPPDRVYPGIRPYDKAAVSDPFPPDRFTN